VSDSLGASEDVLVIDDRADDTYTAAAVYSPKQVEAAARATYAAFIGAGFAFANWGSRIPQVRDRLDLTPAELGLVLLAIAAGSLVALSISGLIIARLNTRLTTSVKDPAVPLGLLLRAGRRDVLLPVVVGPGFPGVPSCSFLFLRASVAIAGRWDTARMVRHSRRSATCGFGRGDRI
jgi:hypothetical protein